MTRDEDSKALPARPSDDRRWVLTSFGALIAIAVFFVAVDRFQASGGSTVAENSAPADTGTVGGASLMPKGPSSN